MLIDPKDTNIKILELYENDLIKYTFYVDEDGFVLEKNSWSPMLYPSNILKLGFRLLLTESHSTYNKYKSIVDGFSQVHELL